MSSEVGGARDVVVVDLNPLLEGAILLAMDELAHGRVTTALNILMSAKVSAFCYDRVKRTGDMDALRRVALAVEGEWP